VTGTLGERGAERRDQAHQPFEPDLGKPHVVLNAHGAEDERRESDRQTVTMIGPTESGPVLNCYIAAI
jgi:hypothetical protein